MAEQEKELLEEASRVGSPQLARLVQVYRDLEKTLQQLRAGATPGLPIDMHKLVYRLGEAKRDVERKIRKALRFRGKRFVRS